MAYYQDVIMNDKEKYNSLKRRAFCTGCVWCGAKRGQESPLCKTLRCQLNEEKDMYIVRKIVAKVRNKQRNWPWNNLPCPQCSS